MGPHSRPPPGIAASLARKGADHARIARRVIRDPELVAEVFEGLGAREPRIKYGSSKVLRLVSERAPALLLPRFDLLAGFLASENTLMKWNAILMIGNLAPVDKDGRIEGILDAFFAPIPGPVMITAANTIVAAARIAAARPDLADRIAGEILKVETATYKTAECREVAAGHALQALDRFFPGLKVKGRVLRFAGRQLASPRAATRKKAERFLRRHGNRATA